MTKNQLHLYYYDGLLANSKEELKKKIIKAFRIYFYLEAFEEVVNEAIEKSKCIILNDKYTYLVSYNDYSFQNDALLNSSILYKKANKLFEYMAGKNPKGSISISVFTNKGNFPKKVYSFYNDASLPHLLTD